MADLDRDALDLLIGVGGTPLITEINGRKYAIHSAYSEHASRLEAVPDPQLSALEVGTLQGLKDLIANRFEQASPATPADMVQVEDRLLHVVSHKQVNLISKTSDTWGRRLVIAAAKMPEVEGFSFAKYYDHESFTVALLSMFVPSPDRDYLLRISANITSEAVKNSDDDGITQIASTRKGAALKTQEALRNRVKLAPFRTFREVEQPASEFIFRVKQDRDGQDPTLALFEADGGAWKLEAMAHIAGALSAVSVPVIS